MMILALDTSSAFGSIALLRDDAVLAETDTGAAMEHAAQIFPKLDQLLSVTNIKLTEINLYAVGIGPGSFNGIRVGIAALKGMRLATNTPMVGISSADAVAQDAAKACPNNCQQIAVLTDARRGEWYFSLYRKDAASATPLGGNTTIAPEKIPALINEPTYFVGPDNRVLLDHFYALSWGEKAHWAQFEKAESFPRAAAIGKLGAQKFLAKGSGDAEVEPIYLRAAVVPPL